MVFNGIVEKSEKKKLDIDLSAEFKKAIHLMENTQKNIFLTGKAGTGKSTLLNYFRKNTKKNIAVLAPTGVAAVNVQGQTIHSFFKFKPNITLNTVTRNYKDSKLYKKIDAIVIDEISMARADLLDCVEKFLRLNGRSSEEIFGGVQVVFIGDLHQLQPVVTKQDHHVFYSKYSTPYFFSANFFENFEMEFVELTKVYRQREENFINLLNRIRNNTITKDDLNCLNARVLRHYDYEEQRVYLTPTNYIAENINQKKISEIPTSPYVFEAVTKGNVNWEHFPTKQTLILKIGAQIMLVNNDIKKRWVNGTMAKIKEFIERKDKTIIMVTLENGEEVPVKLHKWDIYRFFLRNNHIVADSVGSFEQYPIMLAWALTIHKSQGKTFQKILLDIDSGIFSAGQAYVALSRCTTLDGVILKNKISENDIWTDKDVEVFMRSCHLKSDERDII